MRIKQNLKNARLFVYYFVFRSAKNDLTYQVKLPEPVSKMQNFVTELFESVQHLLSHLATNIGHYLTLMWIRIRIRIRIRSDPYHLAGSGSGLHRDEENGSGYHKRQLK